jgi:hypothetical protein
MSGAGHQQERLSQDERFRWFLAGIIEGEGSVSVSIKAHPSAKFGYYVDPEFFIYQKADGRKILEMARKFFGKGRIYPKPGNEKVLVFTITCRRSLKEKVVPFLKKYMTYSPRIMKYKIFAEIVERMENREHWTPEGLARIVEMAYAMNPESKGKERQRDLKEVLSRILRGHTPDAS